MSHGIGPPPRFSSSIPSLAAFAFLRPIFGLSLITAIIPLTTYTLLILLRNNTEGFRAVPADVLEAAEAMGYSRWERLRRIELPLAIPLMVSGVRLAVVTVITRGFFLFSDRELELPAWAVQGLRYAPLAALVAVIAPEIVLTDGALISTWQDARIYAVLVGTAYFWWRRGILGMIVTGTAVLLALKIGLNW